MKISYIQRINTWMKVPLLGLMRQLEQSWLNVDNCIEVIPSRLNCVAIENECEMYLHSRHCPEHDSLLYVECIPTQLTKSIEIIRIVHDIAHFIDFVLQGKEHLITPHLFKWDQNVQGRSVGYPYAEARTWPITVLILKDLPFLVKAASDNIFDEMTRLAILFQLFHKKNKVIPPLHRYLEIHTKEIDHYFDRALKQIPTLDEIKDAWTKAVRLSNTKQLSF